MDQKYPQNYYYNYNRKTVLFSDPIKHLILLTFIFIIIGFALLLFSHYDEVSSVFEYPRGEEVNFVLALIIIPGWICLLASILTAFLLLIIIADKVFLSKEKKICKYRNMLNKIFLAFSIIILVLGLVIIPITIQYIHNEANNNYLALIESDKTQSTNEFTIASSPNVFIGNTTLVQSNNYAILLKFTGEKLTSKFIIDLFLVNSTSNDTLDGFVIYSNRIDAYGQIKNGKTNEIYHIIYPTQYFYFHSSTSSTTTNDQSRIIANIDNTDGSQSSSAVIMFIEDPGFVFRKNSFLLNSVRYFTYYGQIIGISSLLLIIDISVLMLKNKEE